MEVSILEIDFLKIRIKTRLVCREWTHALPDYPRKTLSPVIYRRTTGGAERLPAANVGVRVLTSDLEHCGVLQLYGSLQLYSFQWVYTCASCSLFIGMAVYFERFRDNLPGLVEPSVAAIPDCFGGVSINRE